MAENSLAAFERNLFQFLQDPSKQAKILQGLGHPEFLHPSSHLTSSGMAKGVEHPTPSGMDKDVEHPISSGTSGGGFGYPSSWYPPPPFPFPHSFPWPLPPRPPPSTSEDSSADGIGEPEANDRVKEAETASMATFDPDDTIELLDDKEAKQLNPVFDPTVKDETSWELPQPMKDFLEKHFKQVLTSLERQAILEGFPKPSSLAIQVPKLDNELKEQMRKKGKDPQFGQEKVLYKLQEQLLEVTGPLTCLWADLLNPEAEEVSAEQVILLLQRVIVLVGSTSHTISLERRKVAWARLNPGLKSLAGE